MKHFVCAGKKDNCHGELMMGLDDRYLIIIEPLNKIKKIIKPMFKVHKSYESACECTKKSVSKKEV